MKLYIHLFDIVLEDYKNILLGYDSTMMEVGTDGL